MLADLCGFFKIWGCETVYLFLPCDRIKLVMNKINYENSILRIKKIKRIAIEPSLYDNPFILQFVAGKMFFLVYRE